MADIDKTIACAFPSRRLTLRSPVARPSLELLVLGAVFLLLGLACVVWFLPELIADTRVGSHYRLAEPGTYQAETYCPSHSVFTWCSLTFTDAEGAHRAMNVSFFGSPFSIDLLSLGRTDDSRLVSVGAQQILTERWLANLLITLFPLCLGAWSTLHWLGMHRMSKRAAALANVGLAPVSVVILSARQDGPTRVFRYRPVAGGKVTRLTTIDDFDPLGFGLYTDKLRDGATARPMALAVCGPDDPTPILLDRELSNLDLTDSERSNLLEVLYPADTNGH